MKTDEFYQMFRVTVVDLYLILGSDKQMVKEQGSSVDGQKKIVWVKLECLVEQFDKNLWNRWSWKNNFWEKCLI